MKVTLLISFHLIDVYFSKGQLHQTFLMNNMDWTWPRKVPGLGSACFGFSHLWNNQGSNFTDDKMRWWRKHVRKKVPYTWFFFWQRSKESSQPCATELHCTNVTTPGFWSVLICPAKLLVKFRYCHYFRSFGVSFWLVLDLNFSKV